MPKKISSEEFEYIFKRVPRLCVDLVIKDRDGVLLTLRNIPPSKGKWHLPGGTVLHGEKLEEAVKRVAKQELNIEVSVAQELGIIEYISSKTTKLGHAVAIAFLCHIKKGDIKLDRQASDFEFFRKIPEKTISEQKAFLRSL